MPRQRRQRRARRARRARRDRWCREGGQGGQGGEGWGRACAKSSPKEDRPCGSAIGKPVNPSLSVSTCPKISTSWMVDFLIQICCSQIPYVQSLAPNRSGYFGGRQEEVFSVACLALSSFQAFSTVENSPTFKSVQWVACFFPFGLRATFPSRDLWQEAAKVCRLRQKGPRRAAAREAPGRGLSRLVGLLGVESRATKKLRTGSWTGSENHSGEEGCPALDLLRLGTTTLSCS